MKDGPLVLAVLIGRSDARWCAALSCDALACRTLAGRIRSRLSSATATTPATDAVVGLAVIRKWHYVVSSASTWDMHALMRASSALHPRRHGQRFLEHDVVASAMLDRPDHDALPKPDSIAGWPAEFAGEHLLSALRRSGARLRCTRGVVRRLSVDVNDLLRE